MAEGNTTFTDQNIVLLLSSRRACSVLLARFRRQHRQREYDGDCAEGG